MNRVTDGQLNHLLSTAEPGCSCLNCRLGREVQEQRAMLDQLSSDNAGLAGEADGLRAAEQFFRTRCDVLEKLLQNKSLTDAEQKSLQGCCPLQQPLYSVCRGCGLTREDYEAAAYAEKAGVR